VAACKSGSALVDNNGSNSSGLRRPVFCRFTDSYDEPGFGSIVRPYSTRGNSWRSGGNGRLAGGVCVILSVPAQEYAVATGVARRPSRGRSVQGIAVKRWQNGRGFVKARKGSKETWLPAEEFGWYPGWSPPQASHDNQSIRATLRIKPKPQSLVYFLRDRDRIKIGYTNNLDKRISDLERRFQVGLDCLATTPGGADKEQRLHRRFDHLRERGEWFRAAPELLDYIDSLEQN